MKSDSINTDFVLYLLCVFTMFVGFHFCKEEKETLTIENITSQQHVSNDSEYGVSTSYVYIVSTDKGVYHISPDGLFASSCFGTLEEGHTYRCKVRGYSLPVAGIFPHIISANEIKD